MKLYGNEISSATSRVRIALALKGLKPELLSIGILGEGAENRQAAYLEVNPQGLVPALLTDEGALVTQSLAIIEYLDERYPEPRLLPEKAEDRAFARSLALMVAAEIHALMPPRVAAHLRAAGFDADKIGAWNRHWMTEGFDAVEALLASRPARAFAAGDEPSVADLFLFPQAINAERAGLLLDRWPRLSAIVDRLSAIPEFSINAPAPRK
ncbi:MAG TPA: maleylacetoacetate isomerase [Magnetospirillaceae bacterium]|nr:maleylacetoacetate isomerase [Magnetospirillaceae bacterium]